MAAAVVLVVLAYPAYLGLVRLPAVQAERDALYEGWAAALSAPVDLDVLSMPRLPGSTRSGVGSPAPVRIDLPGDATAILLVELAPEWLEASERTGAAFRIRIVAEPGSGAPILAWEASEARVLELIEAHEGLPLLVRGRDLPAGHYRLSVGRAGAAGTRDLSFLELEVTASPAP